MGMISRRTLLVRSAQSAAFVLTARKGAPAQARVSRVAVHVRQQVGRIRPELHGHFAEHLGSCTYGGLWVGPQSKIPNIGGFRKAAVEYLKALGVPVLRWPGGCFADDYHWRDGVGDPAKRPKRVNLWWGQYTEDNSFGTHEFIGLCKAIGAQPYFAGNVGSGTPEELRNWVEYCNFPRGSTLSEERAANGSREPFGIRYWGVGNENWGCGGNMTAQEYASNYKRYATFIRPRGGIGNTQPFLIACGPNRNDPAWTRGFFDTIGTKLSMVDGFAMHFYSNSKSPATNFTAASLRDQLGSFAEMERAVVQQHSFLRGYDPSGRIGLLADEWGVWDAITPEDEKRYGKLFQQITIRSAVAAALGLNVFHRQADKLVMCNIAQIANVLHSIILTDGDKTIRTPTYWTFELLKPHRGKMSLGIEQDEKQTAGLSVSASKDERQMALTFVNSTLDEPQNVECDVTGATPAAVSARIIHHADMNAHNTFENPDLIVPAPHKVDRQGSRVTLLLPPLSVVTVEAQVT
jgi:alpha-N-arabinofuranosidase